VFSNGLTGYPLGAAVGGSDFLPFDKSEAEIQKFCQSFMTELVKYVGPDIDLPIMGMGVGEKELGYLFGQYKRISLNSSSGGRPFMSNADPSVSIYYVL
jgi:glutamate dehydrogenase (NADP+)